MTYALNQALRSGVIATFLFLFAPVYSLASDSTDGTTLALHDTWVGFACIAIFAIAYIAVLTEEITELSKSKPVMLAAGLIWGIIGYQYAQAGLGHVAEAAVRHNLLEFAELMLFLLAAMTYVNAMEERSVFEALRSWLVRKGFGPRRLFWITGALSFLISPIADNLTTALLMAAVVLACARGNTRFIAMACTNIVVAANAGGAFSPFGDITTLMVWQKNVVTPQGAVGFATFFSLFLPALVNWLIPATVMSFFLRVSTTLSDDQPVPMKRGAKRIIGLFLITVTTAVGFHSWLHLPPVVGMLTGLSFLKLFGHYLHGRDRDTYPDDDTQDIGRVVAFDVFKTIARAEWDTLFFFYGVVLCVGGLGFLGYLDMVSVMMYRDLSTTTANTLVGVLSAVFDNIPVMFAVLTMNPEMSMGQWLLVTMTAGVGGSLLSVGSAAGVALMGYTRGGYTFMSHIRWTPLIAIGYAASIVVHLLINKALF